MILTAENRVYHLNLLAENIANDVLLVGDPARVAEVSKYFDKIDFKTAHREFITHSGTYRGKRLTVMSTGIGTDNIDIAINELDAAVNIDPATRTIKGQLRKLNIYRLGTSGSIQEDVQVNSLVVSAYAIGLDGLMTYYNGLSEINETQISDSFLAKMNWPSRLPYPYCISASEDLQKKFSNGYYKGITVTAPGFYAPQGREIRLKPALQQLNEQLSAFRFADYKICNWEMETSAIYGLGKLLQHECLTVCVIIANRATKEFTTDYKTSIDKLISTFLETISKPE